MYLFIFLRYFIGLDSIDLVLIMLWCLLLYLVLIIINNLPFQHRRFWLGIKNNFAVLIRNCLAFV